MRRLSAMLMIAALFAALVPSAVLAQDECPTTTVDENIALVQGLYEAVANSDAETIDQILADDYVHNVNRYGLPEDPTSNEDEIQLTVMMHQFYPGGTDVVREIFGVDDKVVLESTRTIDRHTFTGEETVLEQPFEFRTMGVLTIECGEIVSMNAMANTLELMVALGVITLPEVAPEG